MLSNCSVCGKIFMKTAKPVCPECARKELDTVKRIRDYLKPKERRNAPLAQISEDLDISIRYIEYLIREKYFDVTRFPSLQYKCKTCDKLITLGEYCSSCAEKLRQNLLNVQEESEKNKKDDGDSDAHFYRSRL
jgi:flagellar operon protein (TIGR03826 family)